MAIRIPIISDFYEKGIKNAERSFKDLAKTSLLTGAAVAGVAKFLADSVKAAAAAGITAIIQPGGAGKDADSIKVCDEAGIAMVFTNMRHFKH